MSGTPLSAERLGAAVEEALPLARGLLDEIRSLTAGEHGVNREPYGEGERVALEALARTAGELGLAERVDPFGNRYFTLRGAEPSALAWLVGSHADSVPEGGNFDGLAGIVAGLTALAAFRRAGFVPPREVTVMAIRGEELSAWYGGQHDGHIGSRAALGLLSPSELDTAVNSRSGRTLRAHMREAGADPAAVGRGAPYLAPARFAGYLELHIEQGPMLEARGIPVGIVTAIRGALRGRSCRCLGEYTHSGAVPHEHRRDAVMATVELIHALDEEWARLRAAGADLVFTVGKLFTDAAQHALTKVPGETEFTLDFRSRDETTLAALRSVTERLAEEIARRRRVRFEFAPFSLLQPAAMDGRFREQLSTGCQSLDIACLEMPSGAGHDAQDFVTAGFRAGMIFVRNSHGSHNPREAMSMGDFALGTKLLAWMLAAH